MFARFVLHSCDESTISFASHALLLFYNFILFQRPLALTSLRVYSPSVDLGASRLVGLPLILITRLPIRAGCREYEQIFCRVSCSIRLPSVYIQVSRFDGLPAHDDKFSCFMASRRTGFLRQVQMGRTDDWLSPLCACLQWASRDVGLPYAHMIWPAYWSEAKV